MRPDVKINDLWMFAMGWLREEIDFPTPQSQTNTVVVPGGAMLRSVLQRHLGGYPTSPGVLPLPCPCWGAGRSLIK